MSLIAWYKLDGNALDSSGNNLNGTASGVSWVSGKIGQAGSFNGSVNISVPHNHKFNLYSQGTLSAWVKPNRDYPSDTSSVAYRGVMGKVIGGGNGQQSFYIDWLGNNTYRNLRVGIGDSSGENSVSVSYDFQQKWTHVVATWDSNVLRLYANNILLGQTTQTKVCQVISNDFTVGSPFDNWDGLIDDARVFNHALSEKEIKELAKAKILHYKFDDFQEPTENLLVNGDSKAGTSNWGLSTNGTGNFSITEDSFFKITIPDAGKYYYLYQDKTISIPAGTDINFSAIFKNNVVGTFALRFVGFVGGSAPLQPMININLDGTGGVKKAIINTKYSVEALTAIRADVLAGSYYGLSNITFEITDLQVELKDHATPFVNGTRTGSVTDSSGYDNHADLALATTPQWVEDSRIGKGSYLFNGTTSGIERTGDISGIKTISMWVNSQTVPTDSRVLLVHRPTGVGLGFYNNGYLILASEGNSQRTAIISNFKNNDWNHIAVVYSDAKVPTCYINGVETAYSTADYWISPETTLFIGRRSSGSAFDGYIDDVRIYATALSADDIKELYETRAQLDNKGNFITVEFVSHGDASINELIFAEGESIESSFLITDIYKET